MKFCIYLPQKKLKKLKKKPMIYLTAVKIHGSRQKIRSTFRVLGTFNFDGGKEDMEKWGQKQMVKNNHHPNLHKFPGIGFHSSL